MTNSLKKSLWQQFGASIDMLENAMNLCPDELWNTDKKIWYQTFHCLFFLDYYLTLNPVNFTPPLPFSHSEFEDKMPERVYTKIELLTYLQWCRNKCHALISNLTNEVAESYWTNESKTMHYPVIEILMYNMRHVQHHTAQLNLILRQEINNVPDWIFRAKDE